MHAKEYIQGVQDGSIVSCQYVKWSVQRHLNDLEKDWEYYFDEESAQWYLDLFDFFHLWEGRSAGQVFKLDGWKSFVVWSIFGWKRKEDGYRRFRMANIEVARKNAKSTLAAAIEIIMFAFDKEPGAQVWSVATKSDQAKICFDIAKNIIKKSPLLKDRWTIYTYTISDLDTASKIGYLSSQADKQDGFNPSCVIIDEFHAHPNSKMYDIVDSATDAREQPLIFIISTAGFNKSGPAFIKRKYSIQVLDPDNPIEDDTLFSIIFTLDTGDDWENPENWPKANPSLGMAINIRGLKAKAKRAKNLPTELNNFLTKHMNVWTDAEEAYIPNKIWSTCNQYEVEPERMKNRAAYFGLDLGSVSDFCAFTTLLEPNDDFKCWDVLTKYYIPEDNFRHRKNVDILLPWVDAGYITLTPGNATDYAFIEYDIRNHLELFKIQPDGFGYDPYKSTDIIMRLTADEVECQPVRQGYITMGRLVDELERMVLTKEINFGSDPVLAWMNGNTVVSKDPAGNRKPNKAKSQEKIDGIVSLLVAIDRAKSETVDDSSIYDDDPVISST